MIGIGLRFITVPTARAARGLPVCAASVPYVVVVPYSTRASSLEHEPVVLRQEPRVGLDVEVPAPAGEVLVELAVHALDRLRRAQHARAELAREHVEVVLRLGVEADPADAAVGDADEQRPDRRVVEHVEGDVEQIRRGRGRAEALVERGGDASLLLLSQPADAGRCRLPCRLLGRAERGADFVVVEVVAVAQHDGCALLRRQVAGQRREILEGRQAVLDRELRQLALGLGRRASSTTIRLAIVKTHARRWSPCSSRG